MTPTEAIDLLSVAAVSSTWQGADPKLARELLEVVRRLRAAHAAELSSHVESRRELSLTLARLGEAERQLEEARAERDSWQRRPSPVAHAGSPTAVEGGTPRGPELDDSVGE